MERSKKYYGIVIFTAVVLIIVLAFCINRFADKEKKTDDGDLLSESNTISEIFKEEPSQNTTKTEDEKTTAESVSGGLTDKNGEGQITLDMSYDRVKTVLDGEKISYDAEDMFIDTKDGTTYLFWSNGSEKCVNSIIFTSTAEGLKVGDTKEKMIELYGDITAVQKDGGTYYCYISGAVQLTVRVKDDKVSGISLGYVKLNAPPEAGYESDNSFMGEYTSEIASDNNHQCEIEYTAETGTRECFVQIAESQVGYINGYLSGENVAFPFSQTDGWTKYGSSAGMPISPWCALFISWCADRAGIDESYLERSATADINWQDFKDKSAYTPKIGDLVYFKYNGFNNPVSYANHVGIVVEYDSQTKTVITVEGNTRGGQCVKRAYRLDDATSEITGFSSVRF